ncbi:MAG: hypothetical protein ACREFO_03900 [Acetobacteraceae bacterium]
MVRNVTCAAVLVCTLSAAAGAQQTDAERMAILKREVPVLTQPGVIAVMASACGLRPQYYGGWARGHQTAAGNAVIKNLWGVDPMAVSQGPAYRAMQWVADHIQTLDDRASNPTPDDCGRLAADPILLGEADDFVGSPYP